MNKNKNIKLKDLNLFDNIFKNKIKPFVLQKNFPPQTPLTHSTSLKQIRITKKKTKTILNKILLNVLPIFFLFLKTV